MNLKKSKKTHPVSEERFNRTQIKLEIKRIPKHWKKGLVAWNTELKDPGYYINELLNDIKLTPPTDWFSNS